MSQQMRLISCGLPVSALCDESPAGLHLDVQPSLHGAHLHVLVQVSVHVALSCGQFQLRRTADMLKITLTGSILINRSFIDHRSRSDKTSHLYLVNCVLIFFVSGFEHGLCVFNHFLNRLVLLEKQTNVP